MKWTAMLRSAAAIAFTLGVAIASPSNAQDKSAPLRVHVFPGAYSSMTVHVADDLGFFAKNGLQVEKVPAQSSSAAIAAMLGGSLDIVESGADLVLANIDKGTNLKYLMSNEIKNYATLVVSNKIALPNESKGYPAVMQDLKGLRFGVNAIGATLHLAAVMMLDEAGMTKDDVQFVATGTGANTVAAWMAGSVDAQLTFAPVPELISELGLGRTLMVAADQGPEGLKFQGLYAGWVTTGEFLDKDKARADAFIKSMQESIDWIRNPDNHEKLVEMAQKYSPLAARPESSDAVLPKMIENYRKYWGYEISPATIDLWNEYALRNGLIKSKVAFDDAVYSGAPKCTDACK